MFVCDYEEGTFLCMNFLSKEGKVNFYCIVLEAMNTGLVGVDSE